MIIPDAEAPVSIQPTAAANKSDSVPADSGAGSVAQSVVADSSVTAASIGAVEIEASAARTLGTVATIAAPAAQTVFASAARSENNVSTSEDVTPVVPAVSPVVGVVGFLNSVVANLLTPFLSPPPNTPDPLTPVVWAVFAFVRRNFFNEAPTITYNPTQTGQTVAGTLATDPEGDALTYTVTGATQIDQSTWVTDTGKLTINQATGVFTYTPNDIDYDSVQTDSFTVSVTDGKTNLLSLFGVPHATPTTINIAVQPPTVERVILNMPPGIRSRSIPATRKAASPSCSPAHPLPVVASRSTDRHRRDRREVPYLWPCRSSNCGDEPGVADQYSETGSLLRRHRANRGAP